MSRLEGPQLARTDGVNPQALLELQGEVARLREGMKFQDELYGDIVKKMHSMPTLDDVVIVTIYTIVTTALAFYVVLSLVRVAMSLVARWKERS